MGEFTLVKIVLFSSFVVGLLIIGVGLFEETYRKKNRYEMIYFGLFFAIVGIVAYAAAISGHEAGYKDGQVDALKGKFKYSITLEPSFEIKENVIRK
jgi:hypothetical protein